MLNIHIEKLVVNIHICVKDNHNTHINQSNNDGGVNNIAGKDLTNVAEHQEGESNAILKLN